MIWTRRHDTLDAPLALAEAELSMALHDFGTGRLLERQAVCAARREPRTPRIAKAPFSRVIDKLEAQV